MRLDPSSASAMKSLDNTHHKHVADSLTQTARRLDITDIDIDYPWRFQRQRNPAPEWRCKVYVTLTAVNRRNSFYVHIKQSNSDPITTWLLSLFLPSPTLSISLSPQVSSILFSKNLLSVHFSRNIL